MSLHQTTLRIHFYQSLLLLIGALNAIGLRAQLTLSDSTNTPLIGDYYQIQRTDTVNDSIIRTWINQTGANQVWDLRNIITDETRDYYWLPPNRGAGFMHYPSANLLEYDSLSGKEFYYRSRTNKLELLGIYDSTRYFLDYTSDPTKRLKFPMSLGSVFQDTSLGFTQYLNSSHTDNVYILRTGLVDAEGALIMPDGMVIDSVLRLRSISIVKNGSLNGSWRSTDTFYSWYSPNHRQYYASFYVVKAGISYRSSGFQYQSSHSFTPYNHSISHLEMAPTVWGIFPQPASQFFYIEQQQGKLEPVILYNLSGEIVKEIELTHKIQKVDCSGLAPGIYYLQQKFNNSETRIQKLLITPGQ